MNMEIEQEYIKGVDKLVPCPEIALDVLQLAHGEACDFGKLASKIETDPNLTANMLHLANSAYFGHMRKISSIHDIIVRLGLESVKMIAITSASVGLLHNPQEAYNLEAHALWQHCHASAILAMIIGRHARIKDPTSLYTAALLHDIGKVILNRPLQVAIYNEQVPPPELSLLEIEHRYLHTDHARVGMFLLEHWGLPAAITVPVGFHHQFEKALIHKLKTRIVHLANRLVEGMGFVAGERETSMAAIEDMVEDKVFSEVPRFHQEMEAIIDEFYEKMNEGSSLTFE